MSLTAWRSRLSDLMGYEPPTFSRQFQELEALASRVLGFESYLNRYSDLVNSVVGSEPVDQETADWLAELPGILADDVRANAPFWNVTFQEIATTLMGLVTAVMSVEQEPGLVFQGVITKTDGIPLPDGPERPSGQLIAA